MNNLRPLLKVIRTVDDGINRGYVTRIFPKTWKSFLLVTGLAISGLLLSINIIALTGGMARNKQYKRNLIYGDTTYVFKPNDIYYEDQISKAEYYEYGFDKISVKRVFDKDVLTTDYEIRYLIPKYRDYLLLSDIDFQLPGNKMDLYVNWDLESYDAKFKMSEEKRNELIELENTYRYDKPYDLIFDKSKIDEDDYNKLKLLGTVKPLHEFYPTLLFKCIYLLFIPLVLLLYLIYLMAVEYEVKSIEGIIEDTGTAVGSAAIPFVVLLICLYGSGFLSLTMFVVMVTLYTLIAVSAKYTVKKKTESQW